MTAPVQARVFPLSSSSSATLRAARFALSAFCAAWLCVLAPAAAAAPAAAGESAAKADEIGVDELQAGMTGYGLSAFVGTEPVRFEVEILGVLRKSSLGIDYVMARLTGQNLETSGVLAGMSGSPVYVDDRLVGAVAFSWNGALEAIAGITPIRAMRQIGELPFGLPEEQSARRMVAAPVTPPGGLSSSPPAASTDRLTALLTKTVPPDFLDSTIRRLGFDPALRLDGTEPATLWSVSGFPGNAQQRMVSLLGAVVPTGEIDAETVPPLVVGGPVAVVLIQGDLRLAAHGTITDMQGDSLVAFGHSFFGLGGTSLPMAASEVLTAVAMRRGSFKLSNVGPVLGAIGRDHQVGVVGRLGVVAPTVPMVIRVQGPRAETFHLRLAALPRFVASLAGSGLVGSLDALTASQAVTGLDVELRARLAGLPELQVRESFEGQGAVGEGIGWVAAVIGYLAENELEETVLESLEVDLVERDVLHPLSLVSATAERSTVRPGETVGLTLEFDRPQGEPFRQRIEVQVPAAAPSGRLSFFVGDGASVDATRLTLEPREPEKVADALELLGSLHTRRQLVVLATIADPGLSVGGEAMPRLPASMRTRLNGASASKKLAAAILEESVFPREEPFQGLARIDLQVAPCSGCRLGDDGSSDQSASDQGARDE